MVRHGTLTPAFAGSSPATPANYHKMLVRFCAKMLPSSNWNRRLASQAGNTGSSPVGSTKWCRGRIGRVAGLSSRSLRFNPRRHHHEEREIFVPRKSLTENAGSKRRLVRKIPSSENGLGVHCTTKCGQEFQISQNNEKKKHTLWKIVPGGFEKIATGDSPYDLYDKIPWDK